jgi:hypothetical protein
MVSQNRSIIDSNKDATMARNMLKGNPLETLVGPGSSINNKLAKILNFLHVVSILKTARLPQYLTNKSQNVALLDEHTLLSRNACGLLAIFGLNAFGLRSKVASTASRLAASFSTLL